MKVFIRKTANGTEYWDKVAKKTVFYPKGTTPNLNEIQTEGMIGQYTASGKVAEPIVTPDKQPVDTNTNIDLDIMDVDQLREFGEQNGIDVPGNMKKPETIRQHILEELNVAADAE